MAVSMLVLQLITPAPSADPLQRKMMAFMMPAMMLWFFWSAPAGLLVYWLVGNIVGFSQQFLINKLTKSNDDDQPPQKGEPNNPKKPTSPQVFTHNQPIVALDRIYARHLSQAAEFLDGVFKGAQFSLQVSAVEQQEGCILDIAGEDVSYLRSENGELLEAVEHLANQVFGRDLEKGERIVCDVEGFRAIREAELRVMAQHAADRVRSTGIPFTFGPMIANERRVIHLALAQDETLHTESVGEGHERRLKVSLKNP
ncbi:MAG: R3H domain-containing nucleic acid-binding protein [Pyrinomonadaceae bacterium]